MVSPCREGPVANMTWGGHEQGSRTKKGEWQGASVKGHVRSQMVTGLLEQEGSCLAGRIHSFASRLKP